MCKALFMKQYICGLDFWYYVQSYIILSKHSVQIYTFILGKMQSFIFPLISTQSSPFLIKSQNHFDHSDMVSHMVFCSISVEILLVEMEYILW